MMKVSIMQPYFFPYIGYFQLMSACDTFVVFDDAQYIRRGWVNRNRILVNGGPKWVTLPVAAAARGQTIAQRQYLLHHRLTQRLRRRLVAAYERAPYFKATMQLVNDVLATDVTGVAAFNAALLVRVASQLDIRTPILVASAIPGARALTGEALVIETCRNLGASGYVNPIGGHHLYRPSHFADAGLTLQFLQSEAPEYRQFGARHVPALSIIDVLMFNDVTDVGPMLASFRLIDADDARSAPPASSASPLVA
jgi:hypothetical protein